MSSGWGSMYLPPGSGNLNSLGKQDRNHKYFKNNCIKLIFKFNIVLLNLIHVVPGLSPHEEMFKSGGIKVWFRPNN